MQEGVQTTVSCPGDVRSRPRSGRGARTQGHRPKLPPGPPTPRQSSLSWHLFFNCGETKQASSSSWAKVALLPPDQPPETEAPGADRSLKNDVQTASVSAGDPLPVPGHSCQTEVVIQAAGRQDHTTKKCNRARSAPVSSIRLQGSKISVTASRPPSHSSLPNLAVHIKATSVTMWDREGSFNA